MKNPCRTEVRQGVLYLLEFSAGNRVRGLDLSRNAVDVIAARNRFNEKLSTLSTGFSTGLWEKTGEKLRVLRPKAKSDPEFPQVKA